MNFEYKSRVVRAREWALKSASLVVVAVPGHAHFARAQATCRIPAAPTALSMTTIITTMTAMTLNIVVLTTIITTTTTRMFSTLLVAIAMVQDQ